MFLGILQLRSRTGPGHEKIGLGRDRAGHLGAQRLSPCFGLAAGHLLKRSREHDGLAGNGCVSLGLLGLLDLHKLEQPHNFLPIMVLGKETSDRTGDHIANPFDRIELGKGLGVPVGRSCHGRHKTARIAIVLRQHPGGRLAYVADAQCMDEPP